MKKLYIGNLAIVVMKTYSNIYCINYTYLLTRKVTYATSTKMLVKTILWSKLIV